MDDGKEVALTSIIPTSRETASDIEANLHGQAQSPLFRLPLELRVLIYQRALTEYLTGVHIFEKPEISHVPCCTGNDDPLQWQRHRSDWGIFHRPCYELVEKRRNDRLNGLSSD